jgi:alkylation response protein AidB-like acyl-CoA dehydrogenase
MRREIFSEEHDLFRSQVRRFVETEVEPKVPEWNERGMTDREIWRRLGEEGLLGTNQPVEYGGAGGDFLYDAILIEELARVRAHALALSLHSDICLPYIVSFGSEAQKRKWVPGAIRGEVILGIAMTEPGAGSDLSAIQTAARRESSTSCSRRTYAARTSSPR